MPPPLPPPPPPPPPRCNATIVLENMNLNADIIIKASLSEERFHQFAACISDNIDLTVYFPVFKQD